MPLLRPKVILYYAGPGDVAGTLRFWADGRRDPRETSLTYSGMVFDIIRDTGSTLYAYARNVRTDQIDSGDLHVTHRPFSAGRGLGYLTAQCALFIRILRDVIRHRPKLMLVQEGTIEWPLLIPFALAGIRIVADLQCSLWPAGNRPTGFRARVRMALWGLFFRHFAWATLGISPEILRQVRAIARRAPRNLLLTLSPYVREDFDTVRPAPAAPPFNILYAGRIEQNKGIYDLVDAARRLHTAHPGRFNWHLCGNGNEDENLQKAIDAGGARSYITPHGQLTRDRLLDLWQNCHATLVPTTSGFPEGLNRVAIESVLLYRPAVVTTVVPAFEVLGKATRVVAPGDVPAMATEIEHLATDPAHYQQMVDACAAARERFFDSPELWGNVVRRVIVASQQGHALTTSTPPTPEASEPLEAIAP